MSRDGLSRFGEALADRRAGLPHATGPDTPFADVKPQFYADAYNLANAGLKAWETMGVAHPPFGFVNRQGETITSIRKPGMAEPSRWMALESMMANTARVVFAETTPQVAVCPYAPVLRDAVGIITPSTSMDGDVHGLDTLRGAVSPGAFFAPTLIVNLIRRMHMLKQLHGARTSHWSLAGNSAKSLLDEPLRHPQQWAKAFMFTLARGMDDEDNYMLRDTFLDETVARRYTELRVDDQTGRESIGWALPTEEFILRAAVKVADRTRGHERQPGDHQRTYPVGTRLGNIEITEPTVKCPGFRLAYAMWDSALHAAVRENLWTDTA